MSGAAGEDGLFGGDGDDRLTGGATLTSSSAEVARIALTAATETTFGVNGQ